MQQYTPTIAELFKEGISKESTDLRNFKKPLTIATQEKMQCGIHNDPRQNDGHIQVIDFFCGSGGMTAGFNALSQLYPGLLQILGGVDINPDAIKSYIKNFNTKGFVCDIKELQKKSNLEKLKSYLNLKDTKPTIVIGCPPCQGFTAHRKKNWDKEDDRNNLVEIFAKIATNLDPTCIVMENVPEMFSKKYASYFERAEKILEKAGYTVHKKVYNTAAFGVPQERFRLLVTAMKKDFLLPEDLYEKSHYLTVRDAIGNLPPVEPGVPYLKDAYHVCAKHKPETVEVIKKVPKDGGNRPTGVGPKCLDKVKGYTDVYGRLYWDKPAITITQYARNPASGRYVHPEQNRGLTIREAARIQGFPDDFNFIGNFDSIFKQIGEAVPPLFSCAVAANTLVELMSPPPKKSQKSIEETYTNTPVSNSFASVARGLKSNNLTKK